MSKAFLDKLARAARDADVIEAVTVGDTTLRCEAREVEEPAWYGVSAEGDALWIGLYTPDRWLSESIEAELMHVGDKIEELLEEELIEQGYDAGPLAIEHFRNDDKVFVFRSKLTRPDGGWSADDPAAVDTARQVLLAYEACFRELGDMSPSDEPV